MNRSNPYELTKKQMAVLDFIEQTLATTGIAPTVRDICLGLNLSSPSTVHTHLKSLEDKGYIRRDPMKSRSMKILKHSNGSDADDVNHNASMGTTFGHDGGEDVVHLPVVGNVAAGEPILAEQNITDTIALPTAIVGDKSSFLLKVRGDSMIEVGINDGDYVVVEDHPQPHNGEIVVALVEDGATVKRYFHEGDHIRLQPENSALEPIIATHDVSIAGKVTAVFRKL